MDKERNRHEGSKLQRVLVWANIVGLCEARRESVEQTALGVCADGIFARHPILDLVTTGAQMRTLNVNMQLQLQLPSVLPCCCQ